jgi:hypothetical protein
MWQPQGIADRLANTIQKLQSQRETGQLVVKHGKGSMAEEGVIIFNNGRVTEARLGSRRGSEVFNRMSRWENCAWTFVRPMDTPPASYPYASSNSDPRLPTVTPNMPLSIPVDPLVQQTGPTEKIVRVEHSDIPPASSEAPHPTCQYQTGLQVIDQMGLSRTHRRLFLLIDGRRSIPDLIRLMGKGKDEVDRLLQDLEQIAIIHIPHGPLSNNT